MTPPPVTPRGFTKRGNKWWTRVPGESKREVGWPDLGQLIAWKTQYKQALKDGTELPPELGATYTPAPNISFAEYARERWWPRYERQPFLKPTFERTGAELEELLLNSWAKLPIAGLTEDQLTEWSDQLESRYKRTPAARQRWLATTILEMAANDVSVPVRGNAAKGLKPRETSGQRRTRTRARRTTLALAFIGQVVQRISAQFWIAFWLQALAGLRVGEAFGAAVSSYTPATDTSPGFLHVERQFHDVKQELADGTMSHFTPWLKTAAGDRRIPLAPTLEAAVRDAIVTAYGHEIGDPWWDLPIADPWDPALVLNRDLPIVVPPGPADTAHRKSLYRKQLTKVAELLGIDLRTTTADGRGLLRPHDLRKIFSTRMLDAGADRAGRSVYLGHNHAAAWDEAAVTADTYSPATLERLMQVSGLAESKLVPACGDLIPPPKPTGDDALLTATDALAALGNPFADSAFRKYLRELAVPTYTNPWHRIPWGDYYRLGELRDMVDRLTGENVVHISDVLRRLYPQHSAYSGKHHIYREVALGNLIRARKSYYGAASVARLEQIYRQIDAGVLTSVREFVREHGKHPAETGLEVLTTSRGDYLDARHVGVGESRHVTHAGAADALSVDESTYWAMLRLLDIGAARHLALGDSELPIDTLTRLTDRRDELIASASLPAVSCSDSGDWIDIDTAAYRLGLPAAKLDTLVPRLGWQIALRGGRACVRTNDVNDMLDDFDAVPLEKLADRLGTDVQSATALADEHRWWNGTHESCSVTAVRATLRQLSTGAEPQLVGIKAAADIGLMSKNAMALRVRNGHIKSLCPVRDLVLGGGSRARRMSLVWRRDVEALRFVIPDGYATLEQIAEQTGVALGRIRTWSHRSPLTVRDPISRRVYARPEDVLAWDNSTPPEGWLTVAELLGDTPYDTTEHQGMLRNRAYLGYLSAVRAGAGLHWHFPPEYRDQLPELLAPGVRGMRRTPRTA